MRSSTQLRALLSLRWQMIRSPGVRLGFALVGLVLLYLLVLAARSAGIYEKAALATAIKLAPQAFLGFGVLAIVAPLTAGGGNQLFPHEQLVAFPVTSRTHFLGGLLLAPVNLVWVLQIFALVAETAYLTAGGDPAPGGLTTLVFVMGLTVIGQALAWVVVGLRQTRNGRRTVLAIGAGVLLTALVVVRTDSINAVLDDSPTGAVVDAVVAGARGDFGPWAKTTAVLIAVLGLGVVGGARACNWALRRPGDAGALREARAVTPRPARGGQLRELIAVDRASVWRAPALRRGGLVLVVLPGIAAAGAAVPWQSLVILPGLVAAGAGLLFGVNAFCLDGSGALWLASLPHDPVLVARAKVIVLTETVLAAVAVAALAGSARSPGTPTAAELAAVVVGGVTCSAFVVAACLSMSIRHPHKADLRGPRDSVAPPGALVMASAQLTLPAGLMAMAFEGTAASDVWWLPLLVGVPIITGSLLWVRESLGAYGRPHIRASVVQVVAAG